jgi:hypothetical protein
MMRASEDHPVPSAHAAHEISGRCRHHQSSQVSAARLIGVSLQLMQVSSLNEYTLHLRSNGVQEVSGLPHITRPQLRSRGKRGSSTVSLVRASKRFRRCPSGGGLATSRCPAPAMDLREFIATDPGVEGFFVSPTRDHHNLVCAFGAQNLHIEEAWKLVHEPPAAGESLDYLIGHAFFHR